MQQEWIHLSVPHLGGIEQEYVNQAIKGNWISSVGPNLDELEREVEDIFGVPALAVSSGTAGLHLAYKYVGIGSGDEVLIQSLTFAATCYPILYQNAKPVFIDSERSSFNLDPQLLSDFLKRRAEINKLPKAIVTVDIFGQSANYDAIIEIAEKYEVKLVEDAAEAAGASYKGDYCGKFGDAGVISLNGNKIITCSGGGILLSRHAECIEKARHWSTQSRDSDPEGLGNYWHSELGYNYRMSNVLAGIARGQFQILRQRVDQRREVAHRYISGLKGMAGIEVVAEQPYGRCNRWLTCLLIDEKHFGVSASKLILRLRASGIDCRPVWKPLHVQPVFRSFESVGGAVAEEVHRRGVCLPSSSCLQKEDQDRILEAIRSVHQNR